MFALLCNMTVYLACKSTGPSKKRLEEAFESFVLPYSNSPPGNSDLNFRRRRMHCRNFDAKAGICRRVESPLFSSFIAAPKRGLMWVCFWIFFAEWQFSYWALIWLEVFEAFDVSNLLECLLPGHHCSRGRWWKSHSSTRGFVASLEISQESIGLLSSSSNSSCSLGHCLLPDKGDSMRGGLIWGRLDLA